MAYQLEARDFGWLIKDKALKNVGPGAYSGANSTANDWNKYKTRGTK
jgi:hypothetical protein